MYRDYCHVLFFPEERTGRGEDFCEKEGIRHITVESEELEIEGFCQNPTNRCYICKKELFEKIWDIATKEGLNAVAEVPTWTTMVITDLVYRLLQSWG